MRIVPLQHEHIEPLTQALYAQWHDFAPWSSPEKIRAYYETCLDSGLILPQAFAAVDKHGRLAGSAALKRHDIAALSQYEYWLGDVFVMPSHRGQGAGRLLVSHCLEAARRLQLPELYLYTPDVQAVYAKFGWHEIGRHWHNGEEVSVMRLDLGGTGKQAV